MQARGLRSVLVVAVLFSAVTQKRTGCLCAVFGNYALYAHLEVICAGHGEEDLQPNEHMTLWAASCGNAA